MVCINTNVSNNSSKHGSDDDSNDGTLKGFKKHKLWSSKLAKQLDESELEDL